MIKKHYDRILIFLGCGIIIFAISLKLYTQYQQKKLVEDYRQYISEMKSQDEAFNEHKGNETTPSKAIENEGITQEGTEATQTPSKEEGDTTKPQIHPNNIIGILTIPKIDLCVGIGEGVDKETLKYSVGHFEKTAMPGKKGNFCVIGHRSYAYGEFFNRLDEIELNDLITVENEEATFQYKVVEITVVKPEEVSVLDQTEDSEITLITCTPIRVGSHRLIIKGILVEN